MLSVLYLWLLMCCIIEQYFELLLLILLCYEIFKIGVVVFVFDVYVLGYGMLGKIVCFLDMLVDNDLCVCVDGLEELYFIENLQKIVNCVVIGLIFLVLIVGVVLMVCFGVCDLFIWVVVLFVLVVLFGLGLIVNVWWVDCSMVWVIKWVDCG